MKLEKEKLWRSVKNRTKRRFIFMTHVVHTHKHAIEPCQRPAESRKEEKERCHWTSIVSAVHFTAKVWGGALAVNTHCLTVCPCVSDYPEKLTFMRCADFHMLGIIASFLFRVWQRTAYRLTLRHLAKEKRRKGVEKWEWRWREEERRSEKERERELERECKKKDCSLLTPVF